MKKRILLFLSLFAWIFASAYDFASLSTDCNTYYFNIIGDGEAELVRGDAPASYSGHCTVPERVFADDEPYGVVSIGESAFSGCLDLTGVSLPQGLRAIRRNAFGWCSSLRSIAIGPNVEDVEPYAFQGCSSLLEFDLSPANKSFTLSDGALMRGGIVVAFPAGVDGTCYPSPAAKEIEEGAFYECTRLGAVDLPQGLDAIRACAFYYCAGLKTAKIPESVQCIETAAFGECSQLAAFAIDPDNAAYGTDGCAIFALDDSTLTHFAPASAARYAVPKGAKAIGPQAFFRCYDLQHIDLPWDLHTIGDAAFTECWGLQTVKLSQELRAIGFGAFAFCESLMSVYVSSDDPDGIAVGEYAFYNIPDEAVLCVPAGALQAFAKAPQWSVFKTMREYELMLEQSILWDQPFDGCHPGQEVFLQATSSSGLPVEYKIVGGEQHASLRDTRLQILSPGIIEVKAMQSGNAEYMPAPPVTRVIAVEPASASDPAAAEPQIRGGNGVITISNAQPADIARVYAPDGTEIYQGRSRSIIAAPGVYIVALPDCVAKVTVK